MENLVDIVNHPSFRRIAACLRPGIVVGVRTRHPELPLALLYERFGKLSFNEPLIRTNPRQYFEALEKLSAALVKTNPRLVIPQGDYEWLQRQIASPQATMVAAMLAAYAAARESHFFTPAEIASVTSTAERTWRERAERGDIPGAFKKGKQWLLPQSAVEVVYQVDLSGIPIAPEDDQEQSEEAFPYDETDPADMLARMERGEIDLI